MKQRVLVTGGFDPLHSGHIEYFKSAKALGDELIVGLNSDAWLTRKKGRAFMPLSERKAIVEALSVVDKVFLSVDKDKTVIKTISKIYKEYCHKFSLCFANGGDQNNNKIPEAETCTKLGIELVDGLGEKIQSSSWILKSK